MTITLILSFSALRAPLCVVLADSPKAMRMGLYLGGCCAVSTNYHDVFVEAAIHYMLSMSADVRGNLGKDESLVGVMQRSSSHGARS